MESAKRETLRSFGRESREEFVVNAAEAAVAEDGHDVVGADFFGHVGDDFFDGGQIGGGFAVGGDFFHQARGVEAFFGFQEFEPRDLRDDYRVGEAEGFGEFGLKNITPRGVCARFENGPEAAAGVADSQGADGFADRGWMMAEVIDESDAARGSADFHAAFYSAEAHKGAADLVWS